MNAAKFFCPISDVSLSYQQKRFQHTEVHQGRDNTIDLLRKTLQGSGSAAFVFR